MSKATELAIIRRSRSINAPVGVSQRRGERENVGEMLDVYVHVESAEDEYLRNEENARKEVFLKGFRLYVKKVYTEEERRFLSALMGKKVTLDRLFRHMKFVEFQELKRLQEKAQANVGILKKLSELSGWSGSEEFIGEFFARMERVQGYEGAEEGTLNALIERRIVYAREYRKREDYKAHYEEWRKEYRKREDVKQREVEYQRQYQRRYRNSEEHRARARESQRAWRMANLERSRELCRESYRRRKERERLANVVS